MQRLLLLMLFTMLIGCTSDQTMVHTVEVEVPVYVEVEVPGPTEYIEIEVPTGTPTEDVEVWVDAFVQVRAVDGVDIIWVIDTSGSMNSYQAQLLFGIENMMNALPETGWRLVMIPTDPDESILEQQFPLVPGDSLSDAEDMYNAMRRGPEEKGFDALAAYIESNPYAVTWMRPDAALLVVFVSDEDEQSDIYSSAADFVNWFTGRRFGNVYLASIVMQDELDSVCEERGPGSQTGAVYMEATDMMFGTILDICTEDWTPGVVDAASQIQPYESIQLSQTPVPQTIRVFVNSTQSSDWTYDQSTNTVHFTVIPTGGSLVEVAYVIQE